VSDINLNDIDITKVNEQRSTNASRISNDEANVIGNDNVKSKERSIA
jgi:hypothetical protein